MNKVTLGRYASQHFERLDDEYGSPLGVVSGAQFFMHDGRPYWIEFCVANTHDPMGEFEVLDIAKVRDEWGMGSMSFFPLDDADEYKRIQAAFTIFMVNVVRGM